MTVLNYIFEAEHCLKITLSLEKCRDLCASEDLSKDLQTNLAVKSYPIAITNQDFADDHEISGHYRLPHAGSDT